MWAVVIQIVATFLLWMIPGGDGLFGYIVGYYYILPGLAGMAAGSGIYATDMGHGIDWRFFFATAFIQVLLVSYLICKFRLVDKLRSWFKKRREDRIGE